jgi:hypothetical protein
VGFGWVSDLLKGHKKLLKVAELKHIEYPKYPEFRSEFAIKYVQEHSELLQYVPTQFINSKYANSEKQGK